jgi:hypothetical protein
VCVCVCQMEVVCVCHRWSTTGHHLQTTERVKGDEARGTRRVKGLVPSHHLQTSARVQEETGVERR